MGAGQSAPTLPSQGSESPKARHVLIIGIDGLGSEFLQACLPECPQLSQLAQHGVLTMHARTLYPTLSAPCWTGVLCGQGPHESGILGNGWMPPEEAAAKAQAEGGSSPEERIPPISGGDVPETIFDLAKAAWRTRGESGRTAVTLGWPWLRYLSGACDDLVLAGPDAKAVEAMAALIGGAEPPRLMFTHLDEVDEAGHHHGWGSPEFYAAAREADTHVGVLLSALDAAGIRDQTLIIVVADHGGVGTNHGGFTMAELLVPLIASGAGAREGVVLNPSTYVSLLDVASTSLYALGLEPGRFMRGRVVREVFEQ